MAAGAEGQSVAYGVRPENMTIASSSAADVVPAEIVVVEPTGADTELLVKAGDAQLTLVTTSRARVNPGDRIGLAIDPAHVHVFDRDGGQRLAA